MFLRFKFFLASCFCVSLFLPISAQTPTAKSFFDQGLILVKEQKLNEALEAFRQSAKLNPQQAAAHGNIGETLLALNRAAEAVAPFKEAVKLSPNDEMFHAGLCQALSITKNHAEAIAQCTEAVRLSEDKIEIHAALITASQFANRPPDEILNLTETALQKFPDDENLLNIAAALYVETGNIMRATAIYEKLAQENSNSALYQVKLADLYLRLERDTEALAAARKASELEPKNPSAYYFSGKIYFELGQYADAANSFQKAVGIDAKMSEAFYYLGLSEARQGKSAPAIAALTKAVNLFPESFYYQKELGNKFSDAKQYDKAIQYLQNAEKIKADDFETKVALGGAFMESGKFDEAVVKLSEADRMKPGNQLVQMLLNVARGRQQGATQIEMMKRYAEQNPKDVKVRESLSKMLLYMRRTAEAEAVMDELIPLLPQDMQSQNMVAVFYTDLGNPEKAIEYYRKALAIQPHHVIYLSLAGSLQSLGRTAEVEEAYRKALEIKPDSIYVLKLYGDFLSDQGKRAEAIAIYKRAVEAEPTNSQALFNLALLYAKTGKMELAKSYYETLRAIDLAQAKTLKRILQLR